MPKFSTPNSHPRRYIRIALVMLVACRSDGPTNPPPPPAAVASVTVSPDTGTIIIGATLQLTATLRDSANNVLTGRSITWAVDDSTVAKVSTSGLVTAVTAGGPVHASATSGSRSGTAALSVIGPATASIGAKGGVVQAAGSGATFRLPAGAITSGTLQVQLADTMGITGVDRPLADRGYVMTITANGTTTFASGSAAVLTLPLSQLPATGQSAVVSVAVAGDTMWFPGVVTGSSAVSARVEKAVSFAASATSTPYASLTPGEFIQIVLPALIFNGYSGPMLAWAHYVSTIDDQCGTYPELSAVKTRWRIDPAISDHLRQDPAQPAATSGNVQVVLVEGINLNVADCTDFPKNGQRTEDYFANLIPVLSAALGPAYPIWAFTYPTSSHITTSGQDLAADLVALHHKYPLSDIVIVAHSMGGLVSRVAAQHLDASTLKQIRGIITLGTPHLGVPLAAFGNIASSAVPSLGVIGFKPSLGLYDLENGLKSSLTEEAPIYAFAGDIYGRSLEAGVDFRDKQFSWLYTDACTGFPSTSCHSDGVVSVASATPSFISRGKVHAPPRAYDHFELFRGAGLPVSPNYQDPLYLDVINDIKSIGPDAVTDLTVSATTSSSATLSFTQVGDGAGGAANYQVRYAPASAGSFAWATAADVASGTCAVPLAGTAVGVNLTCTVLGLAANTAYNFQVVAFRGTLNVNAVLGGYSNVATGSTTVIAAPLLGDWSVTYGAPTTVTITSSSGVYTITAKTATVVTNSSCTIPAGTVLGTFSGTSPNFTGQHGLWYTNTCAFAYYTSLTVTLNSDGTLTERTGNGETHILTKVSVGGGSPPTISNLQNTLVGVNTGSCNNTPPGNSGLGSLYSTSFSFADPGGDVSSAGSPVTLSWIGSNGGSSSLPWPVLSSTGNGTAGTMTLNICWWFGATSTSITETFVLQDITGSVSNALTVTLQRPTGANATIEANPRAGSGPVPSIPRPWPE